MNSCYCKNCNIKISDIYSLDDSNIDNYHFFCKKCIKLLKFCSKSKCKKLFLLNDIDVKNLKIVFLNNNRQHFFLYDDIKDIIIKKYGSFNNLQKIINQKSIDKQLKIQKNNNIKANREKLLKDCFLLNKIEFKNYGDCYSYINYGKPDLEIVLQNELNKINEKNSRRIKLANELKNLNINLDESLTSCYEYINKIGNKPLKEILRNIEIEHFLKYKTDYDELCKIYNHSKAKDLAIRKYIEAQQQLPKNINKKITSINLKFE